MNFMNYEMNKIKVAPYIYNTVKYRNIDQSPTDLNDFTFRFFYAKQLFKKYENQFCI